MKAAAWRYYGNFYRASRGALALCVAASAGQSLLAVPLTLLVRYAVDKVLPQGRWLPLAGVGLLLFALQLAGSGITLAARFKTLTITKNAVRDLREQLLQRVLRFSRTHYAATENGQWHALIVQDTERVDVMSNALVAVFLPAAAAAALLGAVLLWLNPFLWLALLLAAPGLWLIQRWLGPRAKSRVRGYNQAFASFSQGVLFVVQRLDLIRLQTAEEFEMARQRRQLDDLAARGASTWTLLTAYSELQDTLFTLLKILILLIGGSAVAAGAMTMGGLLAFYVAAALLSGHLHAAAMVVPQLLAGNESLRTLYALAENPDAPPYAGQRRVSWAGRIELQNVAFSYNERPLLRSVNLTLEPGRALAIVGPNGSGKTTLVNLILGFYRPREGRVLADGAPFDELDIAHLRRSFGVVPQHPALFSGTVWDNLTYGDEAATREQVLQAAQLAVADEFIEQLPQGYETPVGDDGVMLSGGQRQRLALARALLRRPRLLILDEPTNHLDAASVARLLENLATLPDPPATLIISHDPAMRELADAVFTLPEEILTKREPAPEVLGVTA